MLRALTTEQRDAAARCAVEARKLADLRAEAERAFPASRRAELDKQVAEQETRAAAADAAFADAREREDRASDEWSAASRLVERCLAFVQEKGLGLPPPAIIDGPDPMAATRIHGVVS